MDLLAQRVQGQDSLSEGDRLFEGAGVLVVCHQDPERFEVHQAQPLPLIKRPVLVAALQEIARVESQTLLETYRRRLRQAVHGLRKQPFQVVFELLDVQPVVAAGVEGHFA